MQLVKRTVTEEFLPDVETQEEPIESGQIVVSVNGGYGGKLADAQVDFVNISTEELVSVVTNAVGTATSPKLPLGEYAVNIAAQPVPGGRWDAESLPATISQDGEIVIAGSFSMWIS